VGKPRVSVHLRIRTQDGSQPYCPAVWDTKKRLKAYSCLVRGIEELHPEGTYHLRYTVNGKRVWEHAGDDPAGAVSLRDSRAWALANPNSKLSQHLAEQQKSAPAKGTSPERFRVDDEIKTYLSNAEKLSKKTHQAYSKSLDLLQQSCKKIFVHQIAKQDLQAFDSFLMTQGDDDRTRHNRVTHVVTFLRNREGRRAGPPILDVTIRVKYVESPPEAYTRQELEDLFRVSSEEDRLPCLEVPQELPFLGTGASFARGKGRSGRVRCLFMRDAHGQQRRAESLAVVPLPSAAERRRREIVLVILVAIRHRACR
jgi:hypothetical protein